MKRYEDLTSACMKNIWLRNKREYPFPDYSFCYLTMETIDELIAKFEHGNWSIRTGFLIGNLAFVQQVNGGDEYLALRKTEYGWESFDSISFESILRRNGEDACRELLTRLINTTGMDADAENQQKTAEESSQSMTIQ